MAVVSLCFSGHPRVILNHQSAWRSYFDVLRSRYDLRIFFHSWASSGLVIHDGKRFVEGSYRAERYSRFDELIAFLDPSSFAIEDSPYDYAAEIGRLGDAFITGMQAHPRAILSQLQSIYLANELRRRFDQTASPSDVVIKLRFDLLPVAWSMNEIDYLVDHPENAVVFAPNPASHRHPGGGGGCETCHVMFDQCRLSHDYVTLLTSFLNRHPSHGNDICDLFAIGRPAAMDRYCGVFPRVDAIYQDVKRWFAASVSDYELEPLPGSLNVSKIVTTKSGHYDIESSPIFVPEKLLRSHLAGDLVAHGESVFTITRV